MILALVPAYCSIDGLVTGETLALDKRTSSYTGTAAIVTAAAYGLFAAALILAACTFFIEKSKRRKALAKLAWNATILGAVLFFAGRIAWVVQS